MPIYVYKSYDRSGSILSGEIEAADRKSALRSLKERQLVPLTVGAKDGTHDRWWNRELLPKGSLPRRDLTRFTAEFSHLMAAKLSVDDALDIIALQPGSTSRLKSFVGRVRNRVIGGDAVWEALEKEASGLPNYYVSAIKAGERSGALSETLADLARFLEVSENERSRLLSALIYPVTLLLAACVVLGIIMSVLLPTIAPLVRDAGGELPAILDAFERARNFLLNYWRVIVASVVAFIAMQVYLFHYVPGWRMSMHTLQLKIPAVRSVVSHSNVARLTSTLGLLLRNGVPLLEALPTAIDTVANLHIRRALLDAVVRLREGQPLQLALAKSAVLPEAALRLIGVGEQTATLDTMLAKTADLYRDSVTRRLDRWATLIAPVMTVLIGLGVGGLVLSIMSAIVSINDLVIR